MTPLGSAVLDVAPSGVCCLLGAADEVPADDDWLAPIERARLAQLHVPKRRADWRLGRWTAKRAVGAVLAVAPQRIAVINAAGGAPLALLDGVPAPLAISLSHAGGRALCALASAGGTVGCDLEVVEPRSATFLRDYFTAAEQALIGGDARRATLLWCAKEAVLKARGEGLREDPRAVVGAFGGRRLNGWVELALTHAQRRFDGWGRDLADFVIVVACESPRVA